MEVKNLYKNLGYVEVHGSDILITVALIIGVLFISAYTSYTGLLAKIRSDWDNQRCSPILLPFAGYIMPVDGKSSAETTMENVNYCIKQDASEVLSIAIMPLEFALYTTVHFLDTIEDGIHSAMNTIRTLLNAISEERDKLYTKLTAFVVPVIEILLYVRDALAKSNGVMTVALYSVMNIYNVIVSGSINLMKIFSNLIISVIAVMIALSIVAFALIPTPASAVGISMYISAVAMLVGTIVPGIVMYALMRVFIQEVSPEKPPKPPSVPKLKKKK